MKATKLFCLLLCVLLLMGQSSVPLSYASSDSEYPSYEEVQILQGDVHRVETKNLSRVSVTDPNVADINNAKPDEVTLIGKEVGQTALFVWDDSGKRTFMVRVVAEDLGLLRVRVTKLIQSAGIEGVEVQENAHEGKIVLTGEIPEEKIEVIDRIVEPLSDKIISFVKKEEIKDQIQIDIQVTELQTALTKELGIDWSTGQATLASDGTMTVVPTDSIQPLFGEAMPTQDGSFSDMFKIGDFYRTQGSALMAKINALVLDGKAKVLSKPRVVVVNGKEATFLVGGEVPIRTTTTNASGGSSQENVEYKEYGVSLAITPEIKDGKVDINLMVEISEIDSSSSSGSDVAFLTRSAKTRLLLDDHQTIVLAGLIKQRRSELNRRVPFLGNVPVVGLLFRSKKNPAPDQDTEIVISVTPTILQASKKNDKKTDKKDVSEKGSTDPVISPEKITVVPPGEAAPVLAKNAAGLYATVPANMEPYVRSVQEKISSAIAYPYEAQENGWQGTVKLTLVIRKDGSLRDAMVRESSGYDVFDKDAVNTAQVLAPYDPFPESILDEHLTLTIPIVYNLDSFLKNVAKHK